MRTPEEVAAEVFSGMGYAVDLDGVPTKPLADLIRARDAEVRAEAARAENARLREGIEAIRDEAWEPWLNRDWQHLDGIRNDCDALLNPTEGEADADT